MSNWTCKRLGNYFTVGHGYFPFRYQPPISEEELFRDVFNPEESDFQYLLRRMDELKIGVIPFRK